MDDVPLSVDRFYEEIRASIRTTDDNSFKLMGLVPLVSAAGLLTFFLEQPIPCEKAPLVVALALVAALITLGVFRSELRNVQTCDWLKKQAEKLEEPIVSARGVPEQPDRPLGIGKTEAEKWIYSITVSAWLSMPPLLTPLEKLSWVLPVYVLVGVPIAIATAYSAFLPVRVDRA